MPLATRERAVLERVPEPVLAWWWGQSLESRYSPSVYSGGAGYAGAAAIGRRQQKKARREDAVSMPRWPVIAATAERIYIFSGPTPEADAIAVLSRASCRSSVSGKGMWRRLDIVSEGAPPRSYTVMFNVLFGSRRRISQLSRALGVET
jgi:hypothetical protein